MPDRIIRDEILRSHRYVGLPTDTDRLLFFHLLLSADSLGNVEATSTAMTLMMARPIDDALACKLLTHLADVDLVRIYEVDGKRYVHIPRFRQKLRTIVGKHPRPPGNLECEELRVLLEKVDVSESEWQKIRITVIERDNSKCVRCSRTDHLSVDHIRPRSKGGKSVIGNLVTLCRWCNSWKRENDDRETELREIMKSSGFKFNELGDVVSQKYYNGNTVVCGSEVKRSEEIRREVDVESPTRSNEKVKTVFKEGLNPKTMTTREIAEAIASGKIGVEKVKE